MKIGMLWFDNSAADLKTKIERAASYYSKKYGQVPNLCFVHPTMLPDGAPAGLVEIRTFRAILPNHFWLGISQNSQKQELAGVHFLAPFCPQEGRYQK